MKHIAIVLGLGCLLVPAAGRAGEPGEIVIRNVGGRPISLYRVEAHYGVVAVEVDPADPEAAQDSAEALAEFWFGTTGFFETTLREFVQVEDRFAAEFKRLSRSRDKRERARAEEYEIALLDDAVGSEVRRVLKREAKLTPAELDKKAVPVLKKPSRLEVELYRDRKALMELVPFTKSNGARYGIYRPGSRRAYLEDTQVPLVTQIWGTELCAQHLLTHFMARKSQEQTHPLVAAFGEWFSFRFQSDPEFDILTVHTIQLRRSKRPGIFLPAIRSFLTVDRAPGQVRNYIYFAPLFLEYVRRLREPLFYRLLTGLNGKIRGVEAAMEWEDILEVLRTTAEEWPKWEREFPAWPDGRYGKADLAEHKVWEDGVFED